MSIVAVVILSISGLIAYCYWGLPTRIELKNNSIDENSNHIILKNSRLLWDTGASGSVLFEDFSQDKTLLGLSIISDYSYKFKIKKMFFTHNITIGNIVIRNFIYTKIDTEKAESILMATDDSGILGMNVIGNYNWLLDFEENILQNFDKTYKYNDLPALALKYTSKRYPFSTIQIDKIRIKKILIDSGFNTDIRLLKSDIDEINKNITPDTIIEGSSNSLFSDSIPHREYIYTNIKINNVVFDSISIIESNRPLIGIGFFRKFDRVFWDSGNREVRFYRD
ncbi:MAG: hypothetical protein Q4B43_10830 [Bacteroidota bacterium]|nr:hypothetical protein [Bacteroidota bacterium]